MSSTPNINPNRHVRDPLLGGDRAISSPPLPTTGAEPMLGGARRIGADLARVQAILVASARRERLRLAKQIADSGQSSLYALELTEIIPEHARQKSDNWRGRFTPSQRIAAMEALSVLGGAASIDALLGVLDEQNGSHVWEAGWFALAGIMRRLDVSAQGTAAAYQRLVDSLSTLSVNGRMAVRAMLAESSPDLALGPLLMIGLASTEWYSRRDAVWLLGKLGDRRATVRLIGVLQGDENSTVRSVAAWALGQLNAPPALDALFATLSDDPDEDVRASAVTAIGDALKRLAPFDESLRPVLARLLNVAGNQQGAVQEALADLVRTYASQPPLRTALHAALAQRISDAR